ncbi:MAG: hypothetical protein ACK459_04760, partial [Akkermansiaceae bacterium]
MKFILEILNSCPTPQNIPSSEATFELSLTRRNQHQRFILSQAHDQFYRSTRRFSRRLQLFC